jgi:hypothetical protein
MMAGREQQPSNDPMQTESPKLIELIEDFALQVA